MEGFLVGKKKKTDGRKIPFWVWVFFIWEGWSAIAIALGIPLSFEVYSLLAQPFNLVFPLAESAVSVASIGFMFYVSWLLYFSKPNAVPAAKAFTLFAAFINAFSFTTLSFSGIYFYPVLAGVAVALGWFFYFSKSKGIERAYPPKERIILKRDSLIPVLLVLGFSATFLTGLFWEVQPDSSFEFGYSDCVSAYGVEECNSLLYEWCVAEVIPPEDISAEEFCSMFKDCLDTLQDIEYCNSEFFEAA